MADIIRVYTQDAGSLRFIGKKYGDEDRVNGMFGAKWGEWFENGWFETLEGHIGNPADTCEDGGAYIGLMRDKHGEPFQYWIGIFASAGTETPEDFECVDFPGAKFGICWLYGKEDGIYMNEHLCFERLKEEGIDGINDGNGACWFFERYASPRFTEPDDKDNIILDIGFFVK